MMKSWLNKEDVLVLKIIPLEAHYWDTESGRLVTFLKTAISSISGQEMDIGRRGDLEI